MLNQFGSGLEPAENWARSVLKSINWTKRKGITRKIEPSNQFLEEEKFPVSYRQSLFLSLFTHAFRMSPRESTLFHQLGKKNFPSKV